MNQEYLDFIAIGIGYFAIFGVGCAGFFLAFAFSLDVIPKFNQNWRNARAVNRIIKQFRSVIGKNETPADAILRVMLIERDRLKKVKIEELK